VSGRGRSGTIDREPGHEREYEREMRRQREREQYEHSRDPRELHRREHEEQVRGQREQREQPREQPREQQQPKERHVRDEREPLQQRERERYEREHGDRFFDQQGYEPRGAAREYDWSQSKATPIAVSTVDRGIERGSGSGSVGGSGGSGGFERGIERGVERGIERAQGAIAQPIARHAAEVPGIGSNVTGFGGAKGGMVDISDLGDSEGGLRRAAGLVIPGSEKEFLAKRPLSEQHSSQFSSGSGTSGLSSERDKERERDKEKTKDKDSDKEKIQPAQQSQWTSQQHRSPPVSTQQQSVVEQAPRRATQAPLM